MSVSAVGLAGGLICLGLSDINRREGSNPFSELSVHVILQAVFVVTWLELKSALA